MSEKLTAHSTAEPPLSYEAQMSLVSSPTDRQDSYQLCSVIGKHDSHLIDQRSLTDRYDWKQRSPLTHQQVRLKSSGLFSCRKVRVQYDRLVLLVTARFESTGYTFLLIGIVGGGVQLGPLSTAATNRPIVPAPDDCDDGEIGGMIGKGNRSTRRKPSPMPLCPPQIPHAVRSWTRAAAVGSQRLTAWATTRPNWIHLLTDVFESVDNL
jgi:hypothetical protein